MPVETSLRDSILLGTDNNLPVNALWAEERARIKAMQEGDAPGVRAIVIIGGGDMFISGADIRELGKRSQQSHLPEVADAIESCNRPVVAAIAGQARGGGLGVALARPGLPKVTLGLVPGAGGTQRLPRLIDQIAAASRIVSGRTVKSTEALGISLIDKLAISNNLLERAQQFTALFAGSNCGARRLSENRPELSQCAEGLERLSMAEALAVPERTHSRLGGRGRWDLSSQALLQT